MIWCISQAIVELMQKLKEHLKELRKVMRNPSLEYTAVNNVQVGLKLKVYLVLVYVLVKICFVVSCGGEEH